MKPWLLFHCNLKYSCLPVAKRVEVIEACYFPMLDLSSRYRLNIEAPASTLEILKEYPRGREFLAALRERMKSGQVKFIASGYDQIAGPLQPRHVNDDNLDRGFEVYDEILGVGAVARDLFFVHEGCISKGLLEVYVEHGAKALVLPFYGPGIIRYSVTAFQALQRYVRDEISLERYKEAMRSSAVCTQGGRYVPEPSLYASDLEVIGYRPYEARAVPEDWARLEEAVAAVLDGEKTILLAPMEPLERRSLGFCEEEPILTKKQPKYNVGRWYRATLAKHDDPSSDLRTRLHASREVYESKGQPWDRELLFLEEVAENWNIGDRIVLEKGDFRCVVDGRRGWTIEELRFSGHERACLGLVPQGYRGDDAGVDYFTGHMVMHDLERWRKETDLGRASRYKSEGDVWRFLTPFKEGIRILQVDTASETIFIQYFFRDLECDRSSVRLAHLTFLPDWRAHAYQTHNGGGLEEHHVGDFYEEEGPFDMGAPVGPLCSSSAGIGMTEKTLRVLNEDSEYVEVTTSMPVLGLLSREEERVFRACFSIAEWNDASLWRARMSDYAPRPTFRGEVSFRITGGRE